MINFESTFLEGISLSGKATVKGKATGKGKIARPTAARIVTGGWGRPIAHRPAPTAPRPTPTAPRPALGSAWGRPMAITPAAVAIKHAQTLKKPITSTSLITAKTLIDTRTKLAAGILKKPLLSLAKKAPFLPNIPLHMCQAKAAQAVAPIAHACKCSPHPVIKKLDTKLCAKGYPTNTATNLLASLHDMNTALEKAALQRLATYEHNKLSAKARFEHEVLEKLAKLANKLAPCHPARTRAHLAILRKT